MVPRPLVPPPAVLRPSRPSRPGAVPWPWVAPPAVPLHCYPFYLGARTGALLSYCTACLLYMRAPVLLLAPRGNPADVPLLCRIYVTPPLYSGVPGGAALEVAQDVRDARALQDVPD